jgi:hypothetical protein
MNFKKTLVTLVFAAANAFTHAENLNTSISTAGTTESLSFSAAVTPTGQFLFNGSKLWMAIVQGQSVYFFSDTLGFVPYPGGLDALLGSSPSEGPSIRSITQTTELINIRGWNTRSILGADAYVGYGSSFSEMIANARYSKLYNFVEKLPTVEASQGAFYCSNPYTYFVVNYVSYQFLASNNTSYPISTIYFDVKLSIPGKPFPIPDSAYYVIPGGLSPNSSVFLQLQPNMFGDFAVNTQQYCGISASTNLYVKITSSVDGNGVSHRY